MTAGAPDARLLSDLAAQALADVESLRASLANISAELDRIPSFIRSFVEKELSQSTDFTLPEWAALFDDLAHRLTALAAGAAQLTAGEAAAPGSWHDAHAAELPDLVESIEALRGFMHKVPGKLTMLPPLLMGPRERAEFIANVEDQSARLADLAGVLPRIAAEAGRLALL